MAEPLCSGPDRQRLAVPLTWRRRALPGCSAKSEALQVPDRTSAVVMPCNYLAAWHWHWSLATGTSQAQALTLQQPAPGRFSQKKSQSRPACGTPNLELSQASCQGSPAPQTHSTPAKRIWLSPGRLLYRSFVTKNFPCASCN